MRLIHLFVSAALLSLGCQGSDDAPPIASGTAGLDEPETGPDVGPEPEVPPVEARSFDRSCDEDADCALVYDGDPCRQPCCGAGSTVNVTEVAAFEEAFEAARTMCSVVETCGSLTPRTKELALSCAEVTAVCRSGQCGVRAEAEGSVIYPCDVDEDCAEPESCRSGQCRLPALCNAAADCPNAGPKNMVCDSGYCRACADSSECGADAECWGSRYEPDDLACVSRDLIHAQCLDHTCPVWCSGGRDYVDCSGELASPRVEGFDQSCSTDDDCVALLQRYWHPVDTGREQCECQCFWQTVNQSAETAYTATFIDMKAEVGCGDAADCECPPRPAVCSNGTCRIE